MLETPVVFLVFNRPDLTERVFAAIAAQQPRRLLVVADGPRREDERALCEATRAIIGRVNWACEVETNFAPENMGCKRRVASGLTWAFERVEEAIILEDDCLPHPSFFRFCSEMLTRFRADGRVMSVGGNNFVRPPVQVSSFYFSRFAHIWGWATWRRAWAHYDVEMKEWPAFRDTGKLPFDERKNRYWRDVLNRAYGGEVDTWDFQWQFTLWRYNGLVVVPDRNLVSNIGFDERATHTTSSSPLANAPVLEWNGAIPSEAVVPTVNVRADEAMWRRVFLPAARQHSLSHRLARRLKRLLKSHTAPTGSSQ